MNHLALIAYCGIASASAALFLAVRDLFFLPQETVLQLRDAIKRIPASTVAEDAGAVKRFDVWFERTLYLSGVGLTPVVAALILILLTFTAGSAVYVWSANIPLTVLAGVVTAAAATGYVLYQKASRIKKMQQQFPAALDILARAVRAGESLEEAIALAAEATRAPLSQEFQRCAKHLDMGLSLQAAMKSLTARTGLLDIRIFATTLSIHRDAGGSLPSVLERLAAVIRDRMEYQRQLKSVTSAGRFSVLTIAAIGPLLFAYLFLIQPDYGKSMWEDPIGRWLLVVAVVSQLIGLLWVSRILKSDY